MKPERSIIAERALAQHCPELFRSKARGSESSDVLLSLGRAGTKLSRIFATALPSLMGDQEVSVRVGETREVTAAQLALEFAPLTANSLLNLAGASLLVSFEAGAVLRMIDHAFGGKGLTPTPLPVAFPPSAGVLIRQLEAMVAKSFAAAIGVGTELVRRSTNLAELEAFPAEMPLAILTMTVEEAGGETWPMLFALPVSELAGLFGDGGPAPARPALPRQTNSAEEPYCDVPLTLSAVIVDMNLPMSSLTRLEPGALIPVSVARNVPLRIGDKTIAHGVIGSIDDRVAIQITQAF